MEERTFLNKSLKFWKKGEGFAVNSRGASRGIGTICDSSKFELVEHKAYTHWIFTWMLQKFTEV